MALKNTDSNARNLKTGDTNPDPITGAPGSHPTGVGIGAAAGGATGAMAGMVGGPVGAVIGAVAGAVVGGFAGKAAGEWNDPTDEEAYWRDNWTTRPYYKSGETFEDYAPAYRYGSTVVRNYPDRPFSDVENDIRNDYEAQPDSENLPYDRARGPIQDAYTRSAQMRAERLRNAANNP